MDFLPHALLAFAAGYLACSWLNRMEANREKNNHYSAQSSSLRRAARSSAAAGLSHLLESESSGGPVVPAEFKGAGK